jgi:hypothetical protein
MASIFYMFALHLLYQSVNIFFIVFGFSCRIDVIHYVGYFKRKKWNEMYVVYDTFPSSPSYQPFYAFRFKLSAFIWFYLFIFALCCFFGYMLLHCCIALGSGVYSNTHIKADGLCPSRNTDSKHTFFKCMQRGTQMHMEGGVG